MNHVTIIGGGITGLAAAFYLQEQTREESLPLRYTLLESSPRLEEMANTIPGLYLAGSAYRGIGIPDCAASARRTVERIVENLVERKSA